MEANMEHTEEAGSEFEKLTDEEIVVEIKDGCNSVALDYLINKYRNFVRAKARSYFLIGADREDNEIVSNNQLYSVKKHTTENFLG
jgi:RNA polymerase sporulation-specific sigma factor